MTTFKLDESPDFVAGVYIGLINNQHVPDPRCDTIINVRSIIFTKGNVWQGNGLPTMPLGLKIDPSPKNQLISTNNGIDVKAPFHYVSYIYPFVWAVEPGLSPARKAPPFTQSTISGVNNSVLRRFTVSLPPTSEMPAQPAFIHAQLHRQEIAEFNPGIPVSRVYTIDYTQNPKAQLGTSVTYYVLNDKVLAPDNSGETNFILQAFWIYKKLI